jgi:hypothetical protein
MLLGKAFEFARPRLFAFGGFFFPVVVETHSIVNDLQN